MRHLSQDGAKIRLSNSQPLSDLAQRGRRIDAATASCNHHALHRLLVGTGYQRLAQQGFSTTARPRYGEQQLAVTGQVVQLPKHRLALSGKELEPRNTGRERVMAEAIVSQKRVVRGQTVHGNFLTLPSVPS